MLKPLGNVNAKHLCNIYKDGVHVAYCADTTNAIAYAFKKTGGNKAKSPFVTLTRNQFDEKTIEAGGWMTNDSEADFVLIHSLSKNVKIEV